MLLSRTANDDLSIRQRSETDLLQEIATLRSALEKCATRIAELDRLAHLDPLVGLPNRRKFLERLDAAISGSNRHGWDSAILFFDVDGLKTINDQFGHEAGDEALVRVARTLASCVRTADFVARLAGDEFAVLLERTDELRAWRMAERVVDAVEQCRFCVAGICLDLNVAVGVAMIRRGDTSKTALSRADKEMYCIKGLSHVPRSDN